MGLADNGSINKRDSSISIARTQQPHISGFRQQVYGRNSHHLDSDYAQKCYGEPSPIIHASGGNRTVSWDEPRMEDDGGKKCCSSLAEVRQGIDAVDEQLLLLLAKRSVNEFNINSLRNEHSFETLIITLYRLDDCY